MGTVNTKVRGKMRQIPGTAESTPQTRRKQSRMLYVDHIDAHGQLLVEKICELDLEGIVAKRKNSQYRTTDRPSPYWIKIKNARYSQLEGREELFERV